MSDFIAGVCILWFSLNLSFDCSWFRICGGSGSRDSSIGSSPSSSGSSTSSGGGI